MQIPEYKESTDYIDSYLFHIPLHLSVHIIACNMPNQFEFFIHTILQSIMMIITSTCMR
jgi:hypothetical protein